MMQHIQGIARSQISFGSLEDRISVDNPVRFVDVFAAKLDLTKIGFSTKFLQKQGRSSFESSLFIRLYLYGYLNGRLPHAIFYRKKIKRAIAKPIVGCKKLLKGY